MLCLIQFDIKSAGELAAMAITIEALRVKGCPGEQEALQATVDWLHGQELLCFIDLSFVSSFGAIEGEQYLNVMLCTHRCAPLLYQATVKFQARYCVL